MIFQMKPWLLAICCLLATGGLNAADLFKADQFSSLSSDRRGSKVGDLITIFVVENSTASNSADTNTDKTSGINLGLSTARGRQEGGSVNTGDTFAGHGSIQRTGRLVAQLTVVIQEVLLNGDLVVKGDQAIDVNGEKTNIRISGRLRKADISENNTVPSSRLADARIEYLGDGYLTDKSKPGLLSRIWTWLGL